MSAYCHDCGKVIDEDTEKMCPQCSAKARPGMSELSKIVEELTPGPYRWAIIPEGSEQLNTIVGHFEKGSGDVHMVYLPEHPGTVVGDDPDRPEFGVILCMTGNGPNSRNNVMALVELLTRAPTLIAAADEAPALRDRVAVLEAEVRAWRSYGEYGLSEEYHVELSEPVYDAMETTGSLAPTPESEAEDED